MILEALCKYYDILAKEGIKDLPREGYSMGKVSFALVLSEDGDLISIIDLRVPKGNGKGIVFQQILVPEQKGRSGKNAPAYFLCDNTKYVLGIGDDEQFSCFNRFKKLHTSFLKEDNPLFKFLDKWKPSKIFSNEIIIKYSEEFQANPNVIFKIEGEKGYLHNDEDIFNEWYRSSHIDKDELQLQCLATGKVGPIARIHTPIKGVKNAQAAGASIVSFNNEAFESYGKESSYNAPISKIAMFKYTTILKYMLSNAKYRLFVGDATVVFWAERTGIYEDLLGELFNPSGETTSEEVTEKDSQTRELARDIIQKYSMGLKLNQEDYELDPNTNVHILGISPNNARLSIAFYEENTFEYFIKRLADHYNSMSIVGNIKAIPIWMILNETLPKASKDKKISPIVSKNLMNSIFTGRLYPASLYNAMITRIRADKDINYKRVAIIKACLVRKHKLNHIKEELSVSLNESHSSVPYQLGRLFAVLEKAQKEALGITTIKDRYFTSASATPASVFPVLIKLSLHHTAKAEWGGSLENQKGQILKNVNEFPKHLSLDEQGEFILGYYHQSQAFYIKNEKKGDVL